MSIADYFTVLALTQRYSFCPYAAIVENPDERLFTCMRDGCRVVSCRKCREVRIGDTLQLLCFITQTHARPCRSVTSRCLARRPRRRRNYPLFTRSKKVRVTLDVTTYNWNPHCWLTRNPGRDSYDGSAHSKMSRLQDARDQVVSRLASGGGISSDIPLIS